MIVWQGAVAAETSKSEPVTVTVPKFLTEIAYGHMFKYICRACMKCKANTEPLLSPRHRSCSQHLYNYCTHKRLCANNCFLIELAQFAGHRKKRFCKGFPYAHTERSLDYLF